MAGKRISQLAAAASLVASDIFQISKLSTTVTMTATTLSAQASDNSFNDSAAQFIAEGFVVGDAVWVSGFTGNAANNIFSAVITALTAGKMTIGGVDGDVIVDDAAGESVTITKWDSLRSSAQAILDLAASGSMPGAGYAQYLAASLEPDAIEAVQKGTFSYAINSSTTKLLMASFGTRLGSAGRMEQRNPQRFMPLRDTTLAGIVSDGTAIILNPGAVTYADPWATYYDRLEAIAELSAKNLAFTTTSQRKPFLPGAYGAIITQYTCFDLTWLALRPLGGTSYGINLWDEISDSATQRIGNSLAFPIHKKCAGTIDSAATGSSPLGSVSYVLLPSTWSAIADPVSASYTFRDDFMGASIDTGVWTRTQSTSGNVEIDTNYQWCALTGNSSWGANGLRRTTTVARAAGTKLVVDFYVPVGAASAGAGMVGWNSGAGIGVADFAHAVNFAASNVINVYEDNNARGTVGTGYTEGAIYRIRITQGASSATYEIQGGPEYAELGGASWTNITPGTTSSSTTPLTPAASAFAASSYVSDFRVFT